MAMLLRRHYEYFKHESASSVAATVAEKLAAHLLIADTPAARTATGASAP